MSRRVKRNRFKKKIVEETGPIQGENEGKEESVPLKIKCTKNYSTNGTQPSRDSIHSDELFDKLLSSPVKQAVNLKPLSFWSKKLKDLESDNNVKKVTKLYEFSASDDSFQPRRDKKKSKRKYVVKKKKQPTEFPIISNKSKPTKQLKVKGISKENKTLISKRDYFTSDQMKQSNFVSSTPGPNKAKIVDMTNFLLLSPIEKREVQDKVECENNVNNRSNENLAQLLSNVQTPKISKRRIQNKVIKPDLNQNSNVRVLRSRKVLILK